MAFPTYEISTCIIYTYIHITHTTASIEIFLFLFVYIIYSQSLKQCLVNIPSSFYILSDTMKPKYSIIHAGAIRRTTTFSLFSRINEYIYFMSIYVAAYASYALFFTIRGLDPALKLL